jgi:predicted  nucleic acid-binding Zn-ribbon protein
MTAAGLAVECQRLERELGILQRRFDARRQSIERWMKLASELEDERDHLRRMVASLEVRAERAERVADKMRAAYDEAANLIRDHDPTGPSE